MIKFKSFDPGKFSTPDETSTAYEIKQYSSIEGWDHYYMCDMDYSSVAAGSTSPEDWGNIPEYSIYI